MSHDGAYSTTRPIRPLYLAIGTSNAPCCSPMLSVRPCSFTRHPSRKPPAVLFVCVAASAARVAAAASAALRCSAASCSRSAMRIMPRSSTASGTPVSSPSRSAFSRRTAKSPSFFAATCRSVTAARLLSLPVGGGSVSRILFRFTAALSDIDQSIMRNAARRRSSAAARFVSMGATTSAPLAPWTVFTFTGR